MNHNRMTYLKVSIIVYGILLAGVFFAWSAARYYLGIVPTMIFYSAGTEGVLILSALVITLVAIVQVVSFFIFRAIKS